MHSNFHQAADVDCRTVQMRTHKYFLFFCLLFFLTACEKNVKPHTEQPPVDFLFHTPGHNESIDSLAKKFLGSASYAWMIKEFNGVQSSTPGKDLIIPLGPYKPGGLTATGYQLLPVLSYNNFSKKRRKNKYIVSAKDFDEQIGYLKNQGFYPLSLDQLAGFFEFGQIPKKSVFIAIEDKSISSFYVAYPILQKYNMSATLFVEPFDSPNKSTRKSKNFKRAWAQLQQSWKVDQQLKMRHDKNIEISFQVKAKQGLTTIKPGLSLKAYINSLQQYIANANQLISKTYENEVQSLTYSEKDINQIAREVFKKQGYKIAFRKKKQENPFFVPNYEINRSVIWSQTRLKQFKQGLNVFQERAIETTEPIDISSNFKAISYQNPQQYEEKNQWRTALLAWKLRRDWLIAQYNNDLKKKHAKDYQALLSKHIELIKHAKNKVSELTSKMKSIADSAYQSALQQKNYQGKQDLLLKALLYDPSNHAALEQLKHSQNKQTLIQYQVKENDSFRKIARSLYKDKSKSILIPLFNAGIEKDADLVAGSQLTLPARSSIKHIKQKQCGVKLTQNPTQLSKTLYQQAYDHFNQNDINKAITKLKAALCLNPKLNEAKEMLQLLQGI